MKPEPNLPFDPGRWAEPAAGKISIQLNPRAPVPPWGETELRRFITAAILEHARLLSAGGATVCKNAPESAVTLVALPGFPAVCVKQFHWRGWGHALKGVFRATQGVRTFRNGIRLDGLGIRTAVPLALAREEIWGLAKSEWIVMEVIPGALELDRYILKWAAEGRTGAAKRQAIWAFGRFLGSLHAAGIFHADLKTCNILVLDQATERLSESGPDPLDYPGRDSDLSFALMDYDEVSFCRTISERQRIKNLMQIFLSTPISINAADRSSFLREYSRHAGLTASLRRKVARSVLKAASGRKILYVSSDGDRIECWERGQCLG
jgi:hypothetical protein